MQNLAELETRFMRDVYTSGNKKRIRAYINFMVGRRRELDVDELVIVVFGKAWQGLAKFRGDADVYTWLHRIAVNEVINVLRRIKFNRCLAIDDMFGETEQQRKRSDNWLPDNNRWANPFECLLTSERLVLFWEAVESLPYREREILKMRMQGFAFKSIWPCFGISEDTAKNDFYRGKSRLRKNEIFRGLLQ